MWFGLKNALEFSKTDKSYKLLCVCVSLMHAVFFVTSARSILIHLRLVASNPAHLRLFQQALFNCFLGNKGKKTIHFERADNYHHTQKEGNGIKINGSNGFIKRENTR